MADTANSVISPNEIELVENKRGVSSVWKHFRLKKRKNEENPIKGITVCKLCSRDVLNSGGTRNLISHLEHNHKSAHRELQDEKTNDPTRPTTTPSKLPPLKFATDNKKLTEYKNFKRQDKYGKKSKEHKAITLSIAKFIAKDLRPFSIVSTNAFKNMIRTLDPRYKLPSRPHFSQTAIPSVYQEEKQKLLREIKGAQGMVSITTDGWTSRINDGYITITCSFITSHWITVNKVLQTKPLAEQHTGVNIAAVLKESLTHWGIETNPPLVTDPEESTDHPEESADHQDETRRTTNPPNPPAQPQTSSTPLISDNASNMTVAARVLGCSIHLGCFAHTLNLAVQKGIAITQVKLMLSEIKRVVTYFHHSVIGTAALKKNVELLKLQDDKENKDEENNTSDNEDESEKDEPEKDKNDKTCLIQSVATRWNSSLDMVERYLFLKPAVYAAVASLEKSKIKGVPPMPQNLQLAEDFVECMMPIKKITTLLCKEDNPTASMIIPLLKQLLHTTLQPVDEDSCVIVEMKAAMHSNLLTRYVKSNIREVLQVCTVVDPRFKDVSLTEEESTATYLALLSLVKKVSLRTDSTDVTSSPPQDSHNPSPEDDDVIMVEDATDSSSSMGSPPPVREPQTTITPTRKPKQKSALASILQGRYQAHHEIPVAAAPTVFEEVQKYRFDMNIGIDDDPLFWWKNNACKYPRLAVVARKYLGIPATSVPSERVFSVAGNIVTANRATIKPENVDALIFLQKNMCVD